MKVTQEQKQETRRKLVDKAAELFVLQGFEATSMKQIAREAGVGDATIYKYFPNKDKLILGFYDVRGQDAIEAYRATADLDCYNFAEKLQLIADTFLEQLLKDREFVELSLQQLVKSPVTLLKDELEVSKAYKQLYAELLAETNSNQCYPNIPMPGVLASMLTDYLFGLTWYWLKDDSEEYINTTQLTDLSVNLIDTVIKNGLLNKAMDLLGFLVKAHIVRGLSNAGNFMSLFKEFSTSMGQHLHTADQ